MLLCRVDGSAVSTIHHPSLDGWRLLLCQPLMDDGSERGDPVLALDCQGAGMHQRVLLTTDGKGIRERVGVDRCPARFMTLAILDD